MNKNSKGLRLLLPICLLALVALFVVPLASAGTGNGNGQANGQANSQPNGQANGQSSTHQSDGTSGTSGSPSQPQPVSNADQNSGGANGQCPGGPYCSTRDGSASQNGNGNGQATGKPCAGCVGQADNKNPQGQKPNGSDANNGYECDGNNGIGKTNPAHTGCKQTPPCQTNCTPPPPCQTNCTPPPPCQHDCTPPPPCQSNCTPPPPCQHSCTPPPACKTTCVPPAKHCGEQGMAKCPKPPVKHHNKTTCPKGMKRGAKGCQNIGILVPRSCPCKSALRVVVEAKAGTVVRVTGAGLSVRARVSKSGKLVLKLRPKRQGILTVRAGNLVKRVGVTCAPEGTQLTG